MSATTPLEQMNASFESLSLNDKFSFFSSALKTLKQSVKPRKLKKGVSDESGTETDTAAEPKEKKAATGWNLFMKRVIAVAKASPGGLPKEIKGMKLASFVKKQYSIDSKKAESMESVTDEQILAAFEEYKSMDHSEETSSVTTEEEVKMEELKVEEPKPKKEKKEKKPKVTVETEMDAEEVEPKLKKAKKSSKKAATVAEAPYEEF